MKGKNGRKSPTKKSVLLLYIGIDFV